MKKFILIRTLLTLIFVSGAFFAGPAFAQQGALTTYTFDQSDFRREFILYSPRGHDGGQSLPLVIVLHGGAGTAQQMIRMTRNRWNELADQHGFYVVYPNALNKHWDFGEGLTSSEIEIRVDDLSYFRSMLTSVKSLRNINGDRVFATGISRGGQASYFLACNLPGQIRAIMPVAMPLPAFMADECVNSPPIGFAVMNGTGDDQVPYNGGTVVVLGQQRDEVYSTDRTLDIWKRRNGCGALAFQDELDRLPGDRTAISIRRWDCRAAPVWLYQVHGGGHTWPSGRQYLPVRLVGPTSREIDAAEEGWKFFSQF